MSRSTSCSDRGPPRAHAGEAAAENERDLVRLHDGDGILHGAHHLFGRSVPASAAKPFPFHANVQHGWCDQDRGRRRQLHASEAIRERVESAFERVESEADVILLAGDLTTTGEPEQAQVLADACRDLSVPVFAVLGNHDYHAGRAPDVSALLAEAGVHVLDRSWQTCEVAGVQLGVVGTKGFVGGFPGCVLPDFGEPLLREVYAETTHQAGGDRAGPARDRALRRADRPAPLRAGRGDG